MPQPLTEATLAEAVTALCQQDDDFAQVVARFGLPPMWGREPGFATLIHIILEQQVSLASALAAFERLLEIATPLTPEAFLSLDDETLRMVGFSRQKIRYGRILADALLTGQLDLYAFTDQDDATVMAQLTSLKGIGPWTANIYLLMVLRRPDIWPPGDVALATAYKEIKRLATRPTQPELTVLAEAWQPWRSAAARILWHSYLSRRR